MKECSNQLAGKFHSIIEFTKGEHLQKDLDKIHRWSKLQEMKFNAKKDKVLEIG